MSTDIKSEHRTLSMEYFIYACDDDLELASKIVDRLNGMRIEFSRLAYRRYVADKRIKDGEPPLSVWRDMGYSDSAIYLKKKQYFSENIDRHITKGEMNETDD